MHERYGSVAMTLHWGIVPAPAAFTFTTPRR